MLPSPRVEALPGRAAAPPTVRHPARREQLPSALPILAAVATSIPAADSTACASRPIADVSSSGHGPPPRSASSALYRFMISFRYFQRMMSGLGTETNVDAENASAIATARRRFPTGTGRRRVSPRPATNRPPRLPVSNAPSAP